MDQPTPPATAGTRRHGTEITARGLVLGALITVVFMAANVYLGLKTGMTFSSSIPAAMLAMGALRLLGGSGILENNIVQTQASAAGTLCNVILVLPGLVLVGHWHGFPFWQTAGITLVGGLLGVAFSIPLRRALVMGAGLPYPEGVAAAEVLRAGEGGGRAAERGLTVLLAGLAGGGLVGFLTAGLRVLAEGVRTALSLGPAVFGLGTGFSLALVGIGYLVGIGACLAILTGVVLAWGIAVPLLTAFGAHADLAPAEAAQAVWSEQVRLVGAGIMAAGAVWTLGTLARPILAGLRAGLTAARASGSSLPRQERDLPLPLVAGGALALVLPLAWLVHDFAGGAGLGGTAWLLVAVSTLFVMLFGFLMAAACGYLAGLLGSSTSPISGIGIITAMAAALLLPLVLGPAAGPEGARFVVAAALLVAAVIVTTASIANDNLQDLKTGQLVDATPWRQQAVLILGVAVGSAVIAPLMALLYQAYGFVGALPRPGMVPEDAMAVPQAALVTQIADGIVRGTLPWRMVLVGLGLGIVLVAVEARLRRRGVSFPALTVGIGMYLPLSVEVTIALGGLLGWLADRRLARVGAAPEAVEAARRRGVLLAAGLLVGESGIGVLLAAADTFAGRSGSLALDGFAGAPALGLGLAVFAGGLALFYHLASRPPV